MSSPKKSINLLFTSVGRRVELLQAFRKAYQDLQILGKVVGTDLDPLAPALQETDAYYLVPSTHTPDFVAAIREICIHENITLVFPLTDHDIPVLAREQEQLERSGVKVMVIPEAMALITRDKWQSYEFLKQLSINTPDSWLPEHLKHVQLSYPVFIKPRFGSAAKNTFKIQNNHELRFFSEYVDKPIIQEFVTGTEITSDVLCDFKGKILSVVSRQRIEVRWGEVAKGETVFDPVIAHTCINIAQALKAIGPITIQCIVQDGTPIFTEINARYGGGAPLGIAAGVPSPRWYLQLADRQEVIPPPLGSYQQGLYLTRYDQSFFLNSDEVAHAETHRIRS